LVFVLDKKLFARAVKEDKRKHYTRQDTLDALEMGLK
jgi:hypothetical protein